MSDEVRKALSANRELQERLQAFLAVRSPIPSLYHEVLEQPVPQRLIDIVTGRGSLPSRPRTR